MGEVAEKDGRREEDLKAVEFSVLRFSDDEVLEQINQVMHRIEGYVEEFAARNGFEKNY